MDIDHAAGRAFIACDGGRVVALDLETDREVGSASGTLNAVQQVEFLERLRLLPIHIEHRPAAWLGQQILPLARTHRLTAYDAAYLELAIREGLPLARPSKAARHVDCGGFASDGSEPRR